MGAPIGMNAALNATVALIEGRTDIAKEIIRSPGSDVKDVPSIMWRLERAVNRAAAKALRNALVRTLVVTPDPKLLAKQSSPEEIYYMGATAVEKILDNVVDELERNNASSGSEEED